MSTRHFDRLWEAERERCAEIAETHIDCPEFCHIVRYGCAEIITAAIRGRCDHELLAAYDAERAALTETQAITQKLVEALEPFAECNRAWIEDGKRAEIRFDWLQRAADAIALASVGVVPENGAVSEPPTQPEAKAK